MRCARGADIGGTLGLTHIPGDLQWHNAFRKEKAHSELTRITSLYVLRIVFTPKLATCNNWDGFLEKPVNACAIIPL